MRLPLPVPDDRSLLDPDEQCDPVPALEVKRSYPHIFLGTKQSAKNAGSIAITHVLLGFGIATWALALWNIRYAAIVTLK